MTIRDLANLNQVVCTLEGMCTWFQLALGDYAVVIHGDSDCSNVLVQGFEHPGAERFFCTNISEDEAIAGRSSERLEDCMKAICGELSPESVFVLGTCLTSLIGDDIRSVVERVSRECGLPIVPLSGAGMQFVSQARICDRFAQLMLDACLPSGLEPQASVNLLGFHPGAHVLKLLERLGVRVNAILSLGSPVEAWRSLPGASMNVVLDRGLYMGFLDQAKKRFGQLELEVPFPVGSKATREFIDLLLSALADRPSQTDDPASIIEPLATEAQTSIDTCRATTAGLRLGYNIGSMKNFEPRTLAREGLIDLTVFEELGFEPLIFVQGDDRPERASAVREILESFDCQAQIVFFSDTVFFEDLCLEHECRLVYASDHLRPQKSESIAFVDHGSLLPGFEGVEQNIEIIKDALTQTGDEES